MHISLICIGQRMPAWVDQGVAEYMKRLPRQFLRVVDLPLKKRGTPGDLARLQAEEGEKMLAAVPATARVVALDERGAAWSSTQLARHLGDWMQAGQDVALLVGGPEGLAPACLARAGQRWSLSPLTLPHALVRVVVAEQLYRAWSLLHHHPYHRA